MEDKSSIDVKVAASKSARAGLTFPVSRIQRYLRKGNYANKTGTAGSVYLTGVIEYLVAEILELSGNAAKDNKRGRIIPRHIMLAIKTDIELNDLLSGAFFSDSGVMPHIHPHLLAKSTNKKVVRNDDEDEEEEEDRIDNSAVAGSQNF